MKYRRRAAVVVLGLGLAHFGGALTGARAERVTFTKPPAVSKDGQGYRIEFAVSRATDVAVVIEAGEPADALRVIRHLAAGVLGEKAPAPLKPNALEQSLLWDGTDDVGRPAGPGAFRVRVSLGLTPRLKTVVGQNAADVGGIRGLAPGPDGNLYVFHCYASHHPNDGTTAVAVFSREGRYLRTIMPYPADLPDERLKGLRTVRAEDGARSPFVYQAETRSFIPGLGDLPSQRPIVTGDGRLAFVGVQEGPRPFAQPGEARLTVLNTDGGVPATGVLETLISPLTDSAASLALSPDEKTVYAAGVRAGLHPALPAHNFTCNQCDHGGDTWSHTVPTNAVYRFRWGDPQVEIFLGRGARGAEESDRLKEPVSVATDGEGNVYVADLGNDRIAVFAADRSFLGQVKVARPLRVEVHRATGAIYVLAGEREFDLIKFENWQTGREVTRLTVGRSRSAPSPVRRPIIALDDRADPPVIWLSVPFSRIEDRGANFGEPLDLRDPDWMGPASMAAVMELSLDRRRGLLYVNNTRRYDVATWKAETFKMPGGRMWPQSNPGSAAGRVGADGNYYVHLGASRARVLRFGPDLKERPFPMAGETDGAVAGYARDHSQGHTADIHGNVYVLWKKLPVEEGDAHRAYVLNMYGPDGSRKEEHLVNASVPFLNSVRVDGAGNIYLAVALRPGTGLLPPGLEGPTKTKRDPDAVHGLNMYPMIYGSIIKFGPAGGAIREGIGGVRCNYAWGTPIDVQGAEWIVPGLSSVVAWSAPKQAPGTVISCVCESPCMDVDGFGRVFFPDAGRSRVGVLDSAGNVVTWFGNYGNVDSAGLASAVPAPDIPLCWPQAVAVGDRAVYVGDRLNRRILAVDLAYAAEVVCRVP